jgi:hypothetical protein
MLPQDTHNGGKAMVVTIGSFLLAALVAGVLGGIAMEFVLRVIGASGWAKTNMLVALGSLFTRERDNAWRVGAVLHAVSAIGFALLYTLLMLKLGYTLLPFSMLLGAGVGFIHGLIVSLGLVWVVAERHPLEEYSEAGLAIGLSHLVGHVAYGMVVGIVIGLWPL